MDNDYYTYADFRAELAPREHVESAPIHQVTDMRTPPRSDTPKEPTKRPPKRRRKKRVGRGLRTAVVVVCLFAVLISVMLLFADFLLPRGVAGYVVETFSSAPDYIYAVSAGTYDTLSEARAASDVIRTRGGAGFIAYDGAYHVLLSAYPDLASAQSVADKNGYTIYPLITDGLEVKDFPLAYRNAVKSIVGYHLDIYRQLYAVSDQLAQNSATPTYCRARIEAIRDGLSTRTESFWAATAHATDATTQNYRAAITAALASLDNLVTHSTDDDLLTDLRWTYIMVLRINRM